MNKNNKFGSLAILSIFFLMPGGLIINPALQDLAQKFPQIPYTIVLMLSTLPSLTVVPSTLISGAIAGKKVKYKTILMIASTLFVVGGALPFFMSNFYVILITRAFFGIGVGLATPLGNALVIGLFDGKERVKMMGLGTLVLNLGSSIFFFLGGYVCAINVNYTWFVHLVGLIPMLLIMKYLPEVEIVDEETKGEIKLPVGVYGIAGVYGLIFLLVNAMILNMSTILISENIGTAAAAGTILSMYTVGGIIGGALFAGVYKITGKFTIPIALLFLGVSFTIVNYSQSIIMMTIGCTLLGVALFIIWPAVIIEVGHISPLNASAMGSAIILAVTNFCGFLSSFYIGLVNQITGDSSARLPIFVGMVTIFFITIVWGMIKVRSNTEVSRAENL